MPETNLDVAPHEIAIVDDRTRRGIRWGNRNGTTTIWLRQGKFSKELPDEDMGQPTYTINTLNDLFALL